jgi:hypothetical protein
MSPHGQPHGDQAKWDCAKKKMPAPPRLPDDERKEQQTAGRNDLAQRPGPRLVLFEFGIRLKHQQQPLKEIPRGFLGDHLVIRYVVVRKPEQIGGQVDRFIVRRRRDGLKLIIEIKSAYLARCVATDCLSHLCSVDAIDHIFIPTSIAFHAGHLLDRHTVIRFLKPASIHHFLNSILRQLEIGT